MTRRRAPTDGSPGATTLSSAAHGGPVEPSASPSRAGWIVGVSSVVVGSLAGTALAFQVESARAASTAGPASAGEAPPPSPASPPAAWPLAASLPVASPPATRPPGPDRRAVLVAQIRTALQHFVAWSRDHAGEPCPDTLALGVPVLDPWGQPLRIVCSDQPADQIAGALSFGPDGEPGTEDDIVSWSLGAEITDLVHGPRWSVARREAGGPRHATHPLHPGHAGTTGSRTPAAAAPDEAPATRSDAPTTQLSPRAGSDDADGDGIPDRR